MAIQLESPEATRVWLARRLDLDAFECPGGKLREDERPIEAAVRELHEETGLVIEAERLTYLGGLCFDVLGAFTFLYRLRLRAGEWPLHTEPEKRSQWRAFTPADALRRRTLPSVGAMVSVLAFEEGSK